MSIEKEFLAYECGYENGLDDVTGEQQERESEELEPIEERAERDNMAVDKFAKAMKEKLAKARDKGRRGWNDKEACSDEHLSALFHSHLKKCNDGNFIDLANFLMFLHVRGANPKALILKCTGCKFFYSYGVFQKCDGCNRAERKDLFEPKDNA